MFLHFLPSGKASLLDKWLGKARDNDLKGNTRNTSDLLGLFFNAYLMQCEFLLAVKDIQSKKPWM